MFDRYDLRDNGRDDAREGERDLGIGGRGGGGDPQDVRDRPDESVFTRDLDLPRGRDREFVRDRNRVYELDGDDSRTLATVGAFRVVSETDLREPLEHGQAGRRSLHHLEDEGLIRTVPSGADGRAVVLTDRGRDLLEANRSIPRDDRAQEPRQEYYAGLRKPRELTHDTSVYRAYQRAEERLRDQGGRVRRVVLDYELKRDYQRFLHERNRGRPDCDGRPDRTPEEIERWAREHDLPYDDEGHVQSPTCVSSTKTPTAAAVTRTSRWSPRTIAAPMRALRHGRASRVTAGAAVWLADAGVAAAPADARRIHVSRKS